MADVHDKKTRSYNMSRIKGKNTKPEILVRRFLYSNGIRYRLHVSSLPGKPDIVISKYKTIIDVRGCFWHGHKGCKFGGHVKSDADIFERRVKPAMDRDEIKEAKWRELGWQVFVVWSDCQLEIRKKSSGEREAVLLQILKRLKCEYRHTV